MLRNFAGALLCAAFALPIAASADPIPDAAQKTLTAGYTLVCTASQDPTEANLAAANALLAPDFVHVDFKGKQMQRDEFIARAKQQLKQLHITSCANTVTSTTLSDPSTVVAVVSGKIAGQIQAPDGNHDIDVSESSSDTWKLVNGTWLQTQSKDVSVLVKIDGKVVQDEGN
jgi:Domain of unknown function (DUF4440)